MSKQLKLPFTLDETIDPACKDCIRDYCKKFPEEREFKIKCHGIKKPEYLIDPNLAATISEEEKEFLKSLLDPVLWAEKFIIDAKTGTPWVARWYQAVMLRCTAARKISRIGRQAGKTDVLVIKALHRVYTRNAYGALFLTPYASQISIIYDRMVSHIISNPYLNESVIAKPKTPFVTIKLANNSVVKGFTAGTKSGGNADAVRGASAPLLIEDEADYLAAGDLDSSMAIVTNYPDNEIWFSSTPTGQRGAFYKRCIDCTYKEFHFPSQVNPNWTQDLDDEFKRNLTRAGYIHEVLAEFGEQEEGVYQNIYVQEALQEYKYEDLVRDNSYVYSIGVDWNSEAVGTVYCVTGYNPKNGVYKKFASEVISRVGWSQTAAIKGLVELNRFWRPKYIYVDKGYGEMHYEVLKRIGFEAIRDINRGPEHPDSKLKDIVKQYDFGSSIETRDPFNGEIIKKAAKPYIVENSVRLFEQGLFKISSKDKTLIDELRAYIIEHRSEAGKPRYASSDPAVGDHHIAAMQLSLIAFTINLGDKVARSSSGNDIMIVENIARSSFRDEEGGLIVNDPNKKKELKTFEPRQGTGNEKIPLLGKNNIPAGNVNRDNGIKLWRYPGFDRDEPPPVKKSRISLPAKERLRPAKRSKF